MDLFDDDLLTVDHVDTCGEALFALHAHTTEGEDTVAGSGGSEADSTDRSDDTVGGDHEIAGFRRGLELTEVTAVGSHLVALFREQHLRAIRVEDTVLHSELSRFEHAHQAIGRSGGSEGSVQRLVVSGNGHHVDEVVGVVVSGLVDHSLTGLDFTGSLLEDDVAGSRVLGIDIPPTNLRTALGS